MYQFDCPDANILQLSQEIIAKLPSAVSIQISYDSATQKVTAISPTDLSEDDKQIIKEVVAAHIPNKPPQARNWDAIALQFHDNALRDYAQKTGDNLVWYWDGKLLEVASILGDTLFPDESIREKALEERLQGWYDAAYSAFAKDPQIQKQLVDSLAITQEILIKAGFPSIATALTLPINQPQS